MIEQETHFYVNTFENPLFDIPALLYYQLEQEINFDVYKKSGKYRIVGILPDTIIMGKFGSFIRKNYRIKKIE